MNYDPSAWEFPADGQNMFDQQDMKLINNFFTDWESERMNEEYSIAKPVPPTLPSPIIKDRLNLLDRQFVSNYPNLKKENAPFPDDSDHLSANPKVFSAHTEKLSVHSDSGPQIAKSAPTPPLSDSSVSKSVNLNSADIKAGIGFGPGSGSGAGRKRNQKIKKELFAKKSRVTTSEKGLLTEEEKKHNHVVSEQRRRQAIRDGFDEIVKLTPSLANGPISAGPGNTGGGHSKSTILNAAAAYILELQDEMIKLKNENLALKSGRASSKDIKIDTSQALQSFKIETSNFMNSPSALYPHHGASFFDEAQDQLRGRYGDVTGTTKN